MAGIENLGNTTPSNIEAQTKELTIEAIKKALEGSGELADVPQLVQKVVEAALQRSRDLNPNISSSDLARAVESVKEAYPQHKQELGKKENEIALRQVIERLYGLRLIEKKISTLTQKAALNVKQLETQKRNATSPEDKAAINKQLEDLQKDIQTEGQFFAQLKQKAQDAPLETPIQEIAKEWTIEISAGANPEKRNVIQGALEHGRTFLEKTKKGTKAKFSDTTKFLNNFKDKVASLYPRNASGDLKASRETAQKLAQELAVEVAKLNEFGDRDIRKQPLYPKTHFRWWMPHEFAAKGYVGRAGELVTSVGEDAALISATSYGIAATLAIPAISIANNPAGWAALATVTTLLATLSLAFKSSVEKEAAKAKNRLSRSIPAWLVPLRLAASGLETGGIFIKAAAKNPIKALAAGASTWAVGSALTKAILISLQSQAVTEQGVAGHIDAVKEELSVLQDAEGLTPGMKMFDGFIDVSKLLPEGLLSSKSNQPQERKAGDGMTILERVDAQPAELLRRMQVSIQAEAGDPAAVREASQWGVPLSGKAGLGPRAIALSQLFGMTLEEAQSLTGLESGEVQDVPQGVREAQGKIRDFALANGLDEYLTEDELMNPQSVLTALSEQFGDALAPKIATYTNKYDNFFYAIDAITATGDATAFVQTFTGQPTTSPDDIDYYAEQLKAAALDIQKEYTKYSERTTDLSQTIGQGIKSIYVTYNTAGASSIDVNKIKLAPEALSLDFTNLDKMVSDIKTTMQQVDAPSSVQIDVSTDPIREQSRLAEHLEDAGIRLDRLADFISPFDEIEAIVALEGGKALDPEIRDQRIFWETLKIVSMALSIQFAMLLSINLPAIRRLQKVQEEWGDEHSELISNAEDKIVDFIQKRMNKLIQESHATINRLEKKHKSITFAFPYESVSQQDVRRVLRSVGNKDFVNQGELRQLFNRGPDIDLAVNNRYSNWLFALGKAKNTQTIISELLPGWDDGREHIKRMQQEVGEKTRGKEKAPPITSRWHDMAELTPEQDVRAFEIAALSEYNRRAELDIALHEVWLDKNTDGKIMQLFKTGKGFAQKAVSDTVSVAKKGLARVRLAKDVQADGNDLWANTFRAAAESKSVRNQIQGRLTTLQNKLESRKKRIEELFKNLSKSHMLYKYDKARKELTEAYKSKYLYAYDKSWWAKAVQTVAPFTRPDFEKQVAKIAQNFKKGEGKEKRPFETFDGYFNDLIKRITEQQNETTPEVIKQRVEALLPVIEITRDGFERSINKKFGTGHSVQFDLTEGEGGAKVRIDIQGPLGEFSQEASVTPAIMSMAGDSDLQRAAGSGLLGPLLWKNSRKSFNFNPNNEQIKKVGNSKELVGAYIQLWEKMQEAAKLIKQQEVKEKVE